MRAKRLTGKHLFADFAQTAVTKALVLVLGIGTGIVTARLLGPHDRGLFSLLSALPTTIAILVKFGLAQANVYFLRRERIPQRAVVGNSLAFALCLGAVAMLGAWLLREQLLGTVLKGATVTQLVVLLPLIPATLLQSYLFGFLQGEGQFGYYNKRLLAQAVATLVGMLVVLWVFRLGMLAALGVTVGIQVVTAIWIVVTSLRIARSGALGFDLRLLSRMLRFGIKSHAQIVVAHLHHRIDLYMVALLLTPSQVAFYAIATRLAELLFVVPESLGLAIYPRLAREHVETGFAMTARACRSMFAFAATAATALSLAGPYLIRLWYGEAYSPAGAPLPLLALGVCLMSVYNLVTRSFTSRNKQQVNITAAGVSLVVNVALNWVLIPRLGIVGAAAATAVSYGLAAAIVSGAFLRDSGLRLRDMLVPQPAEMAAVVASLSLTKRLFPQG